MLASSADRSRFSTPSKVTPSKLSATAASRTSVELHISMRDSTPGSVWDDSRRSCVVDCESVGVAVLAGGGFGSVTTKESNRDEESRGPDLISDSDVL